MNKKIELNGCWEFRPVGSETWKEGKVPGCVQMDLMALGELPDPFYRMNEIEFHKIEQEEWVYRKCFHWDDDCGSNPVFLVFEGIDTLADVYLNGKHLGRAENMFIPYRFDVKDELSKGENILEVYFDSPVKTIRAMQQNCSTVINASNEPARPFVRKAQYSYGWDWGPRIAQTGLWRPVYIELIEKAEIRYPFFDTVELAGNSAVVRMGAEIEAFTEEILTAVVKVSFKGEGIFEKRLDIPGSRGIRKIDLKETIDHPRLWYPNGLGEQPLYDVSISVHFEDTLLDEYAFKAGIRTVRLMQDKDEEGRSFIFEINGIKVFAKGVDWIPGHNLAPTLEDEYFHTYIRMAKDANMNMIRIWGGGYFEFPAFYQACDEMGLMVWQDFMFACAEYPDQFDWFQKLVETEAVHAVKSLRKHPSLVLWCGNNECNWLMQIRWNRGSPKYLGNYIYKEILPKVCSIHDPHRPYWVSSPYGDDSDPCGMAEGNRHNWDVWARWMDFRTSYQQDTGRFLSEFGFQAMPCWKTVLSFTEPEDRHIFSPVMLAHNKNVEGTEKLLRYLAGNVGLPRDFRSFVYLTQFMQAEAVKLGVEHWRTRKFKTAGALYWQLNDCWPVASWASVDYYRRKKGLYYYSAKFFDHILPVLKYEEGKISLHCVNDHLRDVECKVTMKAYGLDGRLKGEYGFSANLIGNGVSKAAAVPVDRLGIGYAPRIAPVNYSSTTLPVEKNGELLDTVVFAAVEAEGRVYGNYLVFDLFRSLALKAPKISVTVEGTAVTVQSDIPAFGVFLEPEADVELSDNCLNLEPGVAYTLTAGGSPGEIEVFELTGMVNRI